MKKIVSLVLTAVVTTSLLAGCTTKKTAEAPAAKDDKSPVTLKMFIADTVMQKRWEAAKMEAPISKKIKDATGVNLDIEFPVGDIKQRMALMISSGEYPELVYAGPETGQIIDAKGLIPLDELIEKYGPNIKKLYGEYLPRLKYSKDDPHIYYLGRDGVRDQQTAPTNGFQIQHQVVKEAGYPKIKTLQDVENVVKAYKEKHPTMNGKPTIGFSLVGGDELFSIFTLFNSAAAATGSPSDGDWFIDQNTYKAQYNFTRPEVKEYFKWLNHLNDIGLLDPEAFTQKNDQFQAKVASGQILAMADDTWHYAASSRGARSTYGNQFGYGLYPVTVNENIKQANFMSPGYPAIAGVGISTKAKDPVRAIKFLDYLASDEAQVLVNWGIEGENYKVENGKRVIDDATWTKRFNDQEWSNKLGLGSWGYPFPARGKGEKDATGQLFSPVTPEIAARNYTAEEKEILGKYGVQMWKDLYPAASEFKERPYGAASEFNIPADSDLARTQTKIRQLALKNIAGMILAKPAEFDAKWDTHVSSLKANGLDKMVEDFNKFLSEKIKFNTGK
ncbi:ABC transporter substrate-binding protein [Clostridium swellfunianum]|uniref:ABC transporter substrate-binding protein n=1 Tax=Clostridium swellfunianum TaxID=1367462 RepID=UPI002030CFC1|nr:ABC transporter substrate-binding protein [Clostridium swellfunianum]MCM0649029.1 ABC transporter substrate-binding protein [Clostridium swellfunianum]